MRISSLGLCVLLPVVTAYSNQVPLGEYLPETTQSPDYYQFKWPIRRVAIIGAGVGGLIAYRELTETGYDVHLYERDDSPGGNWHYSEETPVDTPIPSVDVTIGDYVPSLPPRGAALPYVEEYDDPVENESRKRAHRAPKPIWDSLTSNAPAPVQQIRELPWPAGTPWALPNRKLQRYLRAFASWHGLNNNDNNPNVSYNTRVELIEKRYDADGKEAGWSLTLKELISTNNNKLRATWVNEDFDAVVIATGRYNAPNVPKIPGLKELAERFPEYLVHSRQYRVPEPYQDQTVLIVGAGTSGGEIARDIIKHAKKVYQSIRPETFPIPERPQGIFLSRIPHNVSIVGEIKQFITKGSQLSEGLVELSNGTVLTGIDRIIFATGYRYTYPFLPQYHNSSLGINDHAAPGEAQPIVTDGTHLRSLYLDAFYIPDPTLTFINANFGMQSFTYAEFLSLAIAKIWSGKADFPSTATLWKKYAEVYKERRGYGRHFQFLGAVRTREGLRFFQGWLNDAAVKYGGKQIDGLPKDTAEVSAVWIRARFGANGNYGINAVDVGRLSAAGFNTTGFEDVSIDGTESWAQDLVYNDYW
ncbi:unnamed protein product [Cyclocybe aegerita]|uniref:Flavin-containing monooxygenase n=1 Tax=Cyclocybe aegerita TaxID=1973307 RepID=A0A8S0WJ66_CYCAE|nr:unnamed protein product [Cyclocybe aegerita]